VRRKIYSTFFPSEHPRTYCCSWPAAITSQISTALEEISSETPRKADLL